MEILHNLLEDSRVERDLVRALLQQVRIPLLFSSLDSLHDFMVAHGITENSNSRNQRQDGFYEFTRKKTTKKSNLLKWPKTIDTEIAEIFKPRNRRKFCSVLRS